MSIGTKITIPLLLLTACVVYPLFGKEDSGSSSRPSLPVAEITGDIVLVNTRTVDYCFILKSVELVSIADTPFIRGIAADIGDDAKDKGLKISIALSDVAVLREFTWEQAKAYYGTLFRETVKPSR